MEMDQSCLFHLRRWHAEEERYLHSDQDTNFSKSFLWYMSFTKKFFCDLSVQITIKVKVKQGQEQQITVRNKSIMQVHYYTEQPLSCLCSYKI